MIESDGGYVREGELLAEAIAAHEGAFQTHAVIKRSISAATWVALSCDRIYVAGDGTQGGALAYRTDGSGSIEYDAKANSIHAADLAALAEKSGHNPALVRAMVLPEAQVYTWDGPEGTRMAGAEAPSGARGVRQLDGPTTILTLTPPEAERVGFATALESADVDALAEELGVEGWSSPGRSNFGESTMKRAAILVARQEKERAELYGEWMEDHNRVMAALETVPSLMEVAESEDPLRYRDYSWYEGTGELTPDAQRLWKRRTDAAIDAWQRAAAPIKDLIELRERSENTLRRLERMEGHWMVQGLVDESEKQIRDALDAMKQDEPRIKSFADVIERNVKRLRENRDRRFI